MYQHYRLKKEDKPKDNSLESNAKDTIKKRLYGANTNEIKIERIVGEVAEKADFEELTKQSKSFRLLHEQLKKFIESY